MEDGVICTIEGLDDLENTLKTLAPKVAKKAVRTAARTAGKTFKAAIEENIERQGLIKSDFMVDHIQINTRAKSGDDGGLTMSVGPASDAYYAGFAEFGTIHEPARPFMRPAFDEKAEEVLGEFLSELWNNLENLKDAAADSAGD